ncbi:expressed unknown protein [Seminavis robusta]|uniref:Uncharacterized protein n=1 Tax=Seminavis robusta TaxID=568900 RepID=A0A9N8DQ76_9STRA|nr:expressed unknown protein [Seminavis robusta]|eukprot:Sro269_g103870.1 n/a (499) ;mRNA; f:4009-5601
MTRRSLALATGSDIAEEGDPEDTTTAASTIGTDHATANHPEKWCISFEQLLEIAALAEQHFGSDRYPRQTMRDVCREIVVPQCARTGKSFALGLNPQGLDIGAYVTHSWDGYFAEFVASIVTAFKCKPRKPNLWICSFSLMQSDNDKVIQNQIHTSEGLAQTPFAKAISKAPLFVCIRNSQCCLFGRIWCVAEVFFAKQYGLFPDHTFVSGPNYFAHVHMSCVDARATKTQDKLLILRTLLQKEGDAEKVDAIIQEFRSHETPNPPATTTTTTNMTHHRSQQEIVRHFLPLLPKHGSVYRKISKAFIRRGIKGEYITTTIGGVKETDYQVQNDTSWIVCGVAGECYVLTQQQLETNYDVENPNEVPFSHRRLRKEGYQEYCSKRKAWAYQVTQYDLDWFLAASPPSSSHEEDTSFAWGEAPWGSLMRIEPGDYLLTTYPLANDGVYRCERIVFEETYAEDDDKASEQKQQTWWNYNTLLLAIGGVVVAGIAAWRSRRQ